MPINLNIVRAVERIGMIDGLLLMSPISTSTENSIMSYVPNIFAFTILPVRLSTRANPLTNCVFLARGIYDTILNLLLTGVTL